MSTKKNFNARNIKKRILIVCEDLKSSKLYFKAFKQDEEYKRNLSAVIVEVHPSKDNSPMGLVNYALKRKQEAIVERNEYDEIWIVLDKDGHKNLKAALTKAKRNSINYALSIICFEIWVLLHYRKKELIFNNCKKLITELKKHYPDYDKGECCFGELRDKINTAIINAEWLEKQNKSEKDRGTHICDLSAYTNVHHLVKLLINQ